MSDGSGRHARATQTRDMREGVAETVPVTFAGAVSRYLASGGEQRFLRKVEAALGGLPLAEITQAAIDHGAAALYPGASPATKVRQYYVPVSAVVHFAAQNGWCEYRKIRRPSVPTKHRLNWLRPDEADTLAINCSPTFRPLYLFWLLTGTSPSEGLYLDWCQVDLTNRLVHIPLSEQAEGRTLTLPPAAVYELSKLPHRSGRVFRRPDGSAYPKRSRSASAVKSAFTRACARADIRDLSIRDLRTTYCVWRLALDRNADLLYELGGRDERMLIRFREIDDRGFDAIRDSLLTHSSYSPTRQTFNNTPAHVAAKRAMGGGGAYV